MPHKFNADRRDKIPKQKQRVTNWAEYNEGLRRRGDLAVWISEDAIGLWSAARRTTRGGQRRFSNLAIELCLTLGKHSIFLWNRFYLKLGFVMNMVAVLVNFFVPGIGSFMLGQGGAGVAQLLMFIIGLMLVVTVFLLPFGLLLMAIAWIWGLITAANANKTQKVVVVQNEKSGPR
jgi:TM2 domain-containing membrane protein YozV